MDDLISRQAAIDAVKEYFKFSPREGRQCAKAIERVPSAQPERKTGQWNYSDDMFETAVCSCCGWDSGESVRYARENFNYCPKCGEKMER